MTSARRNHATLLSRRRLLKSSSIAVGAFGLPAALAARAQAKESQSGPKAKRAIVILLQGGCSGRSPSFSLPA